MGKTLLQLIEEIVDKEVSPELRGRKASIAKAILQVIYNESEDRKSVDLDTYAEKDVGKDAERIREFTKYCIIKMRTVLRIDET